MSETLKRRINKVIFGVDTPAGKAFDIFLLVFILASVAAVVLESIPAVSAQYSAQLHILEWLFTIVFTAEYILRLYSSANGKIYAKSFYGIIDLAAILPTYLSILIPGAQYFLILRALRMLRVLRILKLTRYIEESEMLLDALRASFRKILIFMGFVLVMSLLLGTAMYIVESPHNPGFQSIPSSIYWTIIAITTVGFGDIVPITSAGRLITSVMVLIGYSIIAVPASIFTIEFHKVHGKTIQCLNCGEVNHAHDAKYCRHCGDRLRHSRIKSKSRE